MDIDEKSIIVGKLLIAIDAQNIDDAVTLINQLLQENPNITLKTELDIFTTNALQELQNKNIENDKICDYITAVLQKLNVDEKILNFYIIKTKLRGQVSSVKEMEALTNQLDETALPDYIDQILFLKLCTANSKMDIPAIKDILSKIDKLSINNTID